MASGGRRGGGRGRRVWMCGGRSALGIGWTVGAGVESKVSRWRLLGIETASKVKKKGGSGTNRLEEPALENLVRGELDAACAQEVEANVVTGLRV